MSHHEMVMPIPSILPNVQASERVSTWRKMVAAASLTAIALAGCGDDRPTAVEPSAFNSSISPSPSPTGEACPPEFVVKEQARPNARVVEKGLKGAPAKALEAVSQQVYHDPEMLEYYGEHFFKKDLDSNEFTDPILDAEGYSVGECLSPEGQAMAVKIDGVFDVLKLSAKDSVASKNARNTGLTDDGRPTVASRPGLSGNLKSIKATMPGGKTIELLRRCGNIVGEAPPFVPSGPTDQPPIPKKNPAPISGPYDQDGSDGDREKDGQPDDNDNDGYDRDDRSEHPKDTDGDGIADKADQCDGRKETFNGYQDRDGCPDTRPADPSPKPSASVTRTPSATPVPTAKPSPRD